MNWNTTWSGSSKPGKQRKYLYNAPLHLRNALLKSHLTKELRQKLKKRSLRIRKGDTVKVMRGQFKGKTGTVDRVTPKKQKVYVTGIELAKRDGSKTLYPLHPSKLLITAIDTTDKLRVKKHE